MDRDNYIKCRNANSFSIDILYDYFTLIGGKLDYDTFKRVFPMFYQVYSSDNSKMLEYYDKKFEVNQLLTCDSIIYS